MLSMLISAAKESLKKDGFLNPAFFLFQNNEQIYGSLMSLFDEMLGHLPNMDEAKTRDVILIGVLAKELKANRVVLIWDAAFRMVSKKDIPEYSELEAPLTYPKSMRTECLIIEDISIPSGKDTVKLLPYKGGDGLPVEFLSDVLLNETDKYESRFPELVLKGYNAIKRKD